MGQGFWLPWWSRQRGAYYCDTEAMYVSCARLEGAKWTVWLMTQTKPASGPPWRNSIFHPFQIDGRDWVRKNLSTKKKRPLR